MKVFFDTNVLIDVAVRTDEYPHSIKVVNETLAHSGINPWVSAISLNNIEYIISNLGHRQKAYRLLRFIRDRFSIIPFRKSVFVKALNSGSPDFEDAIQMASAEQLGMDYIVTRNTDHFRESEVPAVTPSEFLEKWNVGEFESVNNVPFLDLKAQHHQIYNEIDDRITEIIANTGFILGKHVEEFEGRFAEIQGAKYCIGVSSGTDALHVALLALGIGPGDRVIVPVNTFVATAEAVSLCGAEPVFVDCDNYYNIDAKKSEDILKQRTTDNGQRLLSPSICMGSQPTWQRLWHWLTNMTSRWWRIAVRRIWQGMMTNWWAISVIWGRLVFIPRKTWGLMARQGL